MTKEEFNEVSFRIERIEQALFSLEIEDDMDRVAQKLDDLTYEVARFHSRIIGVDILEDEKETIVDVHEKIATRCDAFIGKLKGLGDEWWEDYKKLYAYILDEISEESKKIVERFNDKK